MLRENVPPYGTIKVAACNLHTCATGLLVRITSLATPVRLKLRIGSEAPSGPRFEYRNWIQISSVSPAIIPSTACSSSPVLLLQGVGKVNGLTSHFEKTLPFVHTHTHTHTHTHCAVCYFLQHIISAGYVHASETLVLAILNHGYK